MAWLWKFVDGAKTAGELYGRVLVVFAAQHYAFQLALPNSQRRGSVLPRSHNDQARKAFEKVAKRALPATHAQLARAIEREAREHHKRIDELTQNVTRAAVGERTPTTSGARQTPAATWTTDADEESRSRSLAEGRAPLTRGARPRVASAQRDARPREAGAARPSEASDRAAASGVGGSRSVGCFEGVARASPAGCPARVKPPRQPRRLRRFPLAGGRGARLARAFDPFLGGRLACPLHTPSGPANPPQPRSSATCAPWPLRPERRSPRRPTARTPRGRSNGSRAATTIAAATSCASATRSRTTWRAARRRDPPPAQRGHRLWLKRPLGARRRAGGGAMTARCAARARAL